MQREEEEAEEEEEGRVGRRLRETEELEMERRGDLGMEGAREEEKRAFAEEEAIGDGFGR